MKFTLFGIDFEISFLFTALLSVMIAFDKTGEIYLFFAAAALHEAAHFILMCIFGAKPKSVKLIPGGINIADNTPKTVAEDTLILLSGPLINLICFFLFKGSFSFINLLLFIYNILPFEGLDGGSIVYLLLGRLFTVKTAEITIKVLTYFAAVLFVAAFTYLYFCGISNYSLIIFSLYLISTEFLKKGVERKP